MQQKRFSILVCISAILLCIITAFCRIGPVEYEMICKIPLEGGTFTTDNLQDVYVYTGNVLKKYDAHGKMLYLHGDKSYGSISSVDVTDPLKVMVFYKDFPEIVLLDNTLSQNGSPISPTDLGFPNTTLACISHDNGAWLYEAQNLQLVHVDINLNVTQKTGNLMQLLGFPINPNYLLEYNNYLYMNDSAQGILIFDIYGTYFKTIPIKGLTTFEIRGNDLFYTQANRIHAFHLKTIMEDITAMPDSLATNARVEKNMLFESYRDTVRVFGIK